MKDILNYEGLYAITSCGKVWSYRSQKFLKPRKNNEGYLHVDLYKDGKRKSYLIHRLVAEVYIPNPENKTDVNHKNEIPTDNYVNNLEWTTHKENMNYGNRNAKIAAKLSKPIYCVELNKVFPSTAEAGRQLGISNSHISKCCRGILKTCGGYHWNYLQ